MEEVEDPPRRRRATDDDDDSILAPGIAVRLQYSLYLFVGLLATMIMRGMMGAALSKMQFLETACAYVPVGSLRDACASDVMSYRVSFTLAVFFFIHWMTVSDLTCCVKSRARAELQEGFFYVKTILVVLLFLCTFALPTSFFIGYAYLCLFASAIFLLINVLFLVDFSYQWSDDWGERSDRNVKWVWYLLAVAIASFVGGIVLNGVGFYLFVPHWNCNLNAFALVFVLLGAVLYVTLSIFVPHGSIVPSSIVFIYTSFLLCSTLRMESDARCNRLASYAGSPNSIWQVLLASVVSSFTLGYAVVSSGGSGAALNVGVDEDGEAENPDESGHLSHYMFFYFIMMMGSMYLAMLSTGWKISGADEHTLLGSVNIAFWVRSTTVCVAIVLYIWSLVAPYTCCQGRDFGFATEEDDWWD